MKITNLGCILEIAKDAQGKKQYPRWEAARKAMQNAKVGGFQVIASYLPQGEVPTHVEGFAHDNRCHVAKKSVCDVQPWGVNRYFGAELWVEGEPTRDILQTYQLTEHAQLCVSMVSGAFEPGENELSVVKVR